jgi:hypothetical protein
MSSRVCFSSSLAAGLLLVVSSYASDKTAPPYRWEQRPIGGGYTLVRELRNGEETFYVCAPQADTCMSAPTIGWRRPFIVTRNGGSEPGWDIYDTSSRKQTYVPYGKGLPSQLADIRLRPAILLWRELNRKKSLE